VADGLKKIETGFSGLPGCDIIPLLLQKLDLTSFQFAVFLGLHCRLRGVEKKASYPSVSMTKRISITGGIDRQNLPWQPGLPGIMAYTGARVCAAIPDGIKPTLYPG